MAPETLIIACVLGLGLTPLARAAALRWRVVDVPDHRKIHARPTPLLGGLAVFASIAGAVVWGSGAPTREVLGVLLGGSLLLCIGLADDFRSIGAGKLLVEFGVVWLVVRTTGISFHVPSPVLSTLLTVFWIVGVANAFNCLDCADGVAAGAGLVAAGAFLVIAVLTHQRPEMLLAGAIAGAVLGFLPYNFHPARIFLGDAGSLTLGYLVAALGVMVSPGILSVPALATKVVVLAIPIYDILFVHLMRYRRGTRGLRALLTSTGKDHLPHRLMDQGLSQPAVALTLVVASATTGAAGVALVLTRSAPSAIILGLIAVSTLVVLEPRWETGGRRPEILAPAAAEGAGLGDAD